MPKISALPPMTTADAADEAPIVDTSVSTTKKWTLTLLLSYLQSLLAWVTYGMIGTNTIRSTNIDWTSSTGKIWWEELGRTTLSVAGDTISVTPITAKKYLRIIISYTTTVSTVVPVIRFNNDSGSNYANRQSANGGADATAATQTGYQLSGAETLTPNFAVFEVLNIAANEKIMQGHVGKVLTTGAGTAPARTEDVVKWVNTSNQITRVDLINTGAGDYAIGSSIVVLGHD